MILNNENKNNEDDNKNNIKPIQNSAYNGKNVKQDTDKVENEWFSRLNLLKSIENNLHYFRYSWYDVEFRRLIYFIIWLILAFYFTGVTNSFADNKGSILDHKHSTLYDSGFHAIDFIFTKPNLSISSSMADNLLDSSIIITVVYVYLFHKGMRIVIYQRWIFVLAMVFTLRSLCLALTIFPLPHHIVLPYQCHTYSNVFFAPIKVAFMGYVNCHDFFFSGHTANGAICAWIVTYYSRFLTIRSKHHYYVHDINFLYKYAHCPNDYVTNNDIHKHCQKRIYYKYNNVSFIDNKNMSISDKQKQLFFHFVHYIMVIYEWANLIAIVVFLLYFKQHYSIDCLMGFMITSLFFVLNEYEMKLNAGIYYFFGRLPSCLPHDKNCTVQNHDHMKDYVHDEHFREYYYHGYHHDGRDYPEYVPVLHNHDHDANVNVDADADADADAAHHVLIINPNNHNDQNDDNKMNIVNDKNNKNNDNNQSVNTNIVKS